MMNEADSKRELAGFGLAVPDFKMVTPEQASEAAEEIGFPVAVKVCSDRIAHKARVGGVALNLGDSAAVEAAVEKMSVAVTGHGHELEHLLVEAMVEHASAEAIIGIKRHGAVGLAMMIGIGGSRAEETARFVTTLLPLTVDAIERALQQLGLTRHPGSPALARACEAVAAYAMANHERLQTLDVNPVVLTGDGRAIATDALIFTGDSHDHE